MSSNNFISIRKKKYENKSHFIEDLRSPDELFLVEELDADSGHLITALGKFAKLENAIKCANDYQAENEVEYGLDIQI